MNIIDTNLVNDLNNNISDINNIFTKILGGLNRQNIIQTLINNDIWDIVLIKDSNINGIVINNSKNIFLNIYNKNEDYSRFENVKFISLIKNNDYINDEDKSFTNIFLNYIINIFENNFTDRISLYINKYKLDLELSYKIFINNNLKYNTNLINIKKIVISYDEFSLYSKINTDINNLNKFLLSYNNFLDYLEESNHNKIVIYSSEEDDSLSSDSDIDIISESDSFLNNFKENNRKINNLLFNNLLPQNIINFLEDNNNFNDLDIYENSDLNIISDSELTTITEL